MRESQAPGVQEEALYALLRQLPVERESPIFVIAQNRVPGVREVDADLVGPAGEEVYFEQAEVAPLLHHLHSSQGAHSAFVHADAPLAGVHYIFVQGLAELEGVLGRDAFHDGGVDLLDLALAQLPVHLDQRAALLANDQQARGIPIQPVRQLEYLGLRPGRPQRLDHPEAQSAAAVDGDAGRLVDDEECRVLVDHRKLGGPRGLWGGGNADPRQPHPVADLQPGIGADAAAVHPDPAAAPHAIDGALWHAPQPPQQEVIDALRGAFFADLDPGDLRTSPRLV